MLAGLVEDFQYRVSNHLLHLELNTVWREVRTACEALEVVVIREDPSGSSILTLDLDPGCHGHGKFVSGVNTRRAVFGAQFVGLWLEESRTKGNHQSLTRSVWELPPLKILFIEDQNLRRDVTRLTSWHLHYQMQRRDAK